MDRQVDCQPGDSKRNRCRRFPSPAFIPLQKYGISLFSHRQFPLRIEKYLSSDSVFASDNFLQICSLRIFFFHVKRLSGICSCAGSRFSLPAQRCRMWPVQTDVTQTIFSVSSEICDRFDYVFFAVSGSFPVMPLSQQRMLSDFSLSATHFPKHFLSIVPHRPYVSTSLFHFPDRLFSRFFNPFPVLLCNCLLPATSRFLLAFPRSFSLLILRLFAKKADQFHHKPTSIMQCQIINAPSSRQSYCTVQPDEHSPTTAIRYSNNFNIFFPHSPVTSFCPDGVLFSLIIKTTRADNYVSLRFSYFRPLLSDPQNQTGRKDSDKHASQHIGRIMHTTYRREMQSLMPGSLQVHRIFSVESGTAPAHGQTMHRYVPTGMNNPSVCRSAAPSPSTTS